MLLIDEMKSSKEVSEDIKKRIDGIIVISCDNVSEYYYAGTDKEYWYSEDFPNVAPVFKHFWLDFKAPSKSVSSVSGIREWDYNYMPSKWAIEVESSLAIVPEINTEEDKKKIMNDLAYDLLSLITSIRKLLPNYTEYLEVSYEEAKKTLDQGMLHLLWQIRDMKELYDLMRVNKWEEAIDVWNRQMNTIKWILTFRLHQKIRIEGEETLLSDCWLWKVFISPNGELAMFKDTKQSLMLSSPLNKLREMVDVLYQKGYSYEETTTMLKKSTMPFLECAMLSISFMHCKNVTLNDIQPAKKTVHNKAQKRRGLKTQDIIQPVTFKTLDIKPMRKVLKTEGKEDTLGTDTAMHICRGHFKNFEEGKGLFGKLHGTYWWNDIVRGTSKKSIHKNYNIDLSEMLKK